MIFIINLSIWDEFPKSKLEAWEVGAKKFFDGVRCRQGHISPRFVSGACCECLRINQLKINNRNKIERERKIIDANEFKVCPECKTTFLVTPSMRKDKVFCSKKCAGSESKRNYVQKNPELVKRQKRMSYLNAKTLTELTN